MVDDYSGQNKGNRQNFNDSKNLNYTDSWLQNTVELAALGTILTGAGTLAVKGDLGGGVRTGKRAIGAMGKGFENYLNRNGSQGTKFGFLVGKKTFRNLLNLPKPAQAEAVLDRFKTDIQEVDNNPEIQKRIRKEVARRLANEDKVNVVSKALDGTPRFKDVDEIDRARVIYQKVREEEANKLLYGENYAKKDGSKNKSREKNQKAPFDKKQLARDMAASGLTGLAFGGGISGFHALDRMSSNPDNQKKLEDTFQYAGSYLNKEDDKRMKKQAGALDMYNSLKGIGRKTPEAIAGGLGFTGVSLGTAKMLNGQDPRTAGKNKEEENNSTRVIIELGQDAKDPHNNSSMPMGLAGLPKLSSSLFGEMDKSAAPLNKLKQFTKDFKGYRNEIDQLKEQNPADVAANRLKNEDIPSLLNNQYGNLAKSEYQQGQFTNKLFDSYTHQAKNEINDTIRDLETRTAKARLKAGVGGSMAAGGGLVGLAAMKRKQEEQSQNGLS